MLCYASGNRDEAVFENPFTFNPDRTPNSQIAFGFGGHVCLGPHLARLEMRILMEELLPRLKSVELAGEPARVEALEPELGTDRDNGGLGVGSHVMYPRSVVGRPRYPAGRGS